MLGWKDQVHTDMKELKIQYTTDRVKEEAAISGQGPVESVEPSKKKKLVSVLTIFIACLRANFEYDLKRIIALYTFIQLGLMIMTVSVGLFGYVVSKRR
jgi:hypothetical protein